jgi:hypothetical protein
MDRLRNGAMGKAFAGIRAPVHARSFLPNTPWQLLLLRGARRRHAPLFGHRVEHFEGLGLRCGACDLSRDRRWLGHRCARLGR